MSSLSPNSQSSGLEQELHSPALTGTHHHVPRPLSPVPGQRLGSRGRRGSPAEVVTLRVVRKRYEGQTEGASTTWALECTPPSCLQLVAVQQGHTVSTVQNLV